MKNAMVDLETLDNVPGGTILSIGAVFFDPAANALGERFYCVVSRASCAAYGLTESADTLAWWAQQSPEARVVLRQATEGGVDLVNALTGFDIWLATHCLARDKNGLPGVNVWGNGSDFDNAFLQVAYARTGRKLPWNFWRNESFRTLKNQVGKRYAQVPKPEFEGAAHNALADAVHQAKHAIALLRYLNSAESAYETATLAKLTPGTMLENAHTGVQMCMPAPLVARPCTGDHSES